MSDCFPCKALVCQTPDDLSYGAASTAIYARNQLSFLITSLPGCYAPPGVLPHVFVYLIDQIPPIFPSGGEGTPIVLRLQGCSSEIVRTVAADATEAEIEAAALAVHTEWGQQQAQCDATSLPGVRCNIFFNRAMSFRCPEGSILNWLGIAPSIKVEYFGPGNALTVRVTNLSTFETVYGTDFVFDNGAGTAHGATNSVPGAVLAQVMLLVVGSVNPWKLFWSGRMIVENLAGFFFDCIVTIVTYGTMLFPTNVTFNETDHVLTVASGMFSGETQAEADAAAKQYIDNLAQNYIAQGILACVPT